ncbi:MAG: SRPBCC domain-containing protein [Microthrixaceae bacterium]|nr:SRPBCC domain-containing protein [Microthrixaceae bacterium]
MPVTGVTSDLDALTLTIRAEFAAPPERVWQIYADPRQLERVWGPPTHPATFVTHEFRPGGRAHYFMTSPEGERYYGWWALTAVDEPKSFAFDDGFAADDTFAPVEGMPVSRNLYTFASTDIGTQAVFESVYESVEGLRKVLEMGVVEGASSAINQIDALLA